jgi:hypothetical protein
MTHHDHRDDETIREEVSEEERDRDLVQPFGKEDPDRRPGDVLGVAHVPAEGTLLPESDGERRASTNEETVDRHGLGNRDVTQGTTGGTGTDTGGGGPGARELRRGSGHTGTDIGR